MSRRKVVPLHDEATEHIIRLRRLLGMLESLPKPPPISDEVLERAGFVQREPSPPDAFLGRRIIAWIEERESRRLARLARRTDGRR